MRGTLVIALAAVCLASCTSSGANTSTSVHNSTTSISTEAGAGSTPTTTSPDVPPPVAPGHAGVDVGVLTSQTFKSGPPSVVDHGEGTYEYLGCWTAWPGLYVYEFDLKSSDGTYPFHTEFAWEVTSSDAITAQPLDIRLSGPGRFSIPVDADTHGSFPPVASSAGYRRSFLEGGVRCEFQFLAANWVGRGDNVSRRPEVEPERIQVNGPEGTVQNLIADIDPADDSAPMWPLADIYMRTSNLLIDRIYVDPTMTMEFVSIDIVGTCISVHSYYTDGPEIYQSRGCETVGSSWYEETYPVRFEDEAWSVGVRNGTREQLAMYTFEGTEPLTNEGKVFDPDVWLDVTNDEGGFEEIARLPVGDGRVSIVTYYSDELGMSLGERTAGGDRQATGFGATIRGLNPWNQCARWGTHDTWSGLFLLIVTEDPTWNVEADIDDWTPIPLVESGGYGVGLLELDEWIQAPDLRATDADGNPVSCLNDH